jgi:hypothetical protein
MGSGTVSENLLSVEKIGRFTNFINRMILTISNTFNRATRCSYNLSRTILDKLRELQSFDVTTSKISSDRGASQKSYDVTAGP